MTELDADARTTGNAAIAALRSALDDAEFRAKRFGGEVRELQAHLNRAQQEAAQLREALARLEGGDSHGG